MSDQDDEKVSPQSSSPSARKEPMAAKPAQRKKKPLPPILDHFNAHDLKILFRCAVSFWVCTLFIVIDPILRNFGQATFFACLVTLFVPPSGVILVFLLGGTTIVVGMALGWAWGTITMKAAQAARPAAQTAARLAALAQTAQATGTNPQILIFDGFMLDTRVTVTWLCMLLLFIYLMARLRQKVPKLALTAVFAWVVSDIYITIGILLPNFQGTIPSVLIKPTAAALAVNLACSLLFFPESGSHLALTSFQRLVGSMMSAPTSIEEYLDHPQATEKDAEVQKTKAGILGLWGSAEANFGFLPLDISYGYWCAEDIINLKESFKRLLISAMTLLDAQLVMHEAGQRAKRVTEETEENKRQFGRHQIMESMNFLELLRQNDVEKSVNESFAALADVSRPLLESCREGLSAIMESIHKSNSTRWFGGLKEQDWQDLKQTHDATLTKLRTDAEHFHVMANKALLKCHEHLFDSDGAFHSDDVLAQHKLTGLWIGFGLEERIGRFASAIERVLAQVIELETHRRRRKLWMPLNITKLFSWTVSSDKTPYHPVTSDVPQLDKKTIKEMHERLQNASKPVKRPKGLSRVVLGVVHWLSNEEGIFGLRVVIATLAMAVIAANRNTAGFFYREKGLWALIMAQTGQILGFADFTYGVITRVIGTIAGGVVGMLCWYIGSGHGPGNPYGLAAVFAVIAVCIMWLRLWAPPQYMAAIMIFGATLVLVVGYSYVDTHIPNYGNPGVGYSVFWRRTLLVLVGFAVAFIVSLFPWPTSQSRSVAKSLAQILHAEADHYAVVLASWSHLDDDEPLIPAIESVTINLAETLSKLAGSIGALKFEFSSSAFDVGTCSAVRKNLEQINRNLAIMHIIGSHLPKKLRDRFAHVSGLLKHNAISDIMVVFSVIEHALKTGDPLPSRLPTPLVVRSREQGHGGEMAELTRGMLQEREWRAYTVVASSYLSVLSLLDDTVLVLKEACGEAWLIPQDLGV